MDYEDDVEDILDAGFTESWSDVDEGLAGEFELEKELLLKDLRHVEKQLERRYGVHEEHLENIECRIDEQVECLEKSDVDVEKERSIRRSLEHLYDRVHEEKDTMLDAVEKLESRKREILRELEELDEFEDDLT